MDELDAVRLMIGRYWICEPSLTHARNAMSPPLLGGYVTPFHAIFAESETLSNPAYRLEMLPDGSAIRFSLG